jgi:hypothetical protein
MLENVLGVRVVRRWFHLAAKPPTWGMVWMG